MALFNGLTRGVQYIGQFVSSMVWSAERFHSDPKPLQELIPVGKRFVSEILDTKTGNVLSSAVGLLVTGGDPFSGSRHDFQAWQTQWGKH